MVGPLEPHSSAPCYSRGTSIYFRESTNQGTSFGAETLILDDGAAPAAVAVEYKNSAGDLVVIWEKAAGIRRIRRTSGSFGAAAYNLVRMVNIALKGRLRGAEA